MYFNILDISRTTTGGVAIVVALASSSEIKLEKEWIQCIAFVLYSLTTGGLLCIKHGLNLAVKLVLACREIKRPGGLAPVFPERGDVFLFVWRQDGIYGRLEALLLGCIKVRVIGHSGKAYLDIYSIVCLERAFCPDALSLGARATFCIPYLHVGGLE